MISLQDIELAQKKWGENIVQIGSLKNDLKASEKATEKMLNDLYAFDLGHVLFKPTKATKIQFRLNFEGAKSYFIGENSNYVKQAIDGELILEHFPQSEIIGIPGAGHWLHAEQPKLFFDKVIGWLS